MIKTIFSFLIIALLTSNCSQNSNLKLGKQALDLADHPLSINIPEFFSEEKNFVDDPNNDLFVNVEEEKIDSEIPNSLFTVYYDVAKNEKKQNLTKFGNLYFENLQMLTDMKDEKIFMIAAGKDSVTTKEKNNLIEGISAKFGEYEKQDQSSDGNYYRWEKDNVVMKVSARSDADRGYGDDEVFTNDQQSSKPDQSIKIYILTKDFEGALKNSYTGMEILHGYFR